MFSVSGTNTPLSTAGPTPFHEQLGENITWIKDWYSPNNSSYKTTDGSIGESFRLKGWFKTNISHRNDPAIKMNAHDILDLAKWKYIRDTEEPVVPVAAVTETKVKVDSELGSALAFSKDEGQISGL